MVACFRLGAVVLPCTEQLRAKDLRLRLDTARPCADRRRRAQPRRARGGAAGVRGDPRPRRGAVRGRAGAARRALGAGALPDHVHERHGRRAEGASSTASATSTASACRPSTGSAPARGELVWCTAASGWSKSARNVFIAPWLRGAAALLHDARFDPHERLRAARARARRRALHGADRVPRDRQARDARAAARAARPGGRRRGAQPGGAARLARGDGPGDPRRLRADRDRPADRRPAGRAGAGRARWARRCRAIGLRVERRRADGRPARRVPTFFLGYLGEHVQRGEDGTWSVEDRRDGRGLAHGRPRRAGRGRLAATSRGATTT